MHPDPHPLPVGTRVVVSGAICGEPFAGLGVIREVWGKEADEGRALCYAVEMDRKAGDSLEDEPLTLPVLPSEVKSYGCL